MASSAALKREESIRLGASVRAVVPAPDKSGWNKGATEEEGEEEEAKYEICE